MLKKNHLKPRINHLTNDTKKTMNTRILSSFFVIFYFALIFLFGVLSDRNIESWSPLNSDVAKNVCLSILLALPIVLIAIISHEIRNIYAKFNKVFYILVFFTLFFVIYSPVIFYLVIEYFTPYSSFVIIPGISNAISLLSFDIIIGMLLIMVMAILLLVKYNILNIKNFLILFSLMVICQLALISLFYFLIKRQWTTLFYLMIIPIMMDTFAYFGGVLFGKRKMCPKISPKKTWEGFFIALLLTQICVSVIVLSFSYIPDKHVLTNIIPVSVINNAELSSISLKTNDVLRSSFSWWIVFIISSISASIMSVVGDLVFSWFKRTYRIKDYGNLIPGHGGVLDRIDSHTFVLGFYFLLGGFIGMILTI